MNKSCRYLIEFKSYKSLDSFAIIYKCVLANALLTAQDLKQNWACGGCIVPQIMDNKPCKYIAPHKLFPIRGSSHTWFSCELLNIVMDLPEEFCHSNCILFEQNHMARKSKKQERKV
ncbi:MAG: hypothetical protein GX892_14540 [Thermoanaerobacteraceae bacterium]|nr:hypothetical protein [Thermoanaerobacteraceae bacterium]